MVRTLLCAAVLVATVATAPAAAQAERTPPPRAHEAAPSRAVTSGNARIACLLRTPVFQPLRCAHP